MLAFSFSMSILKTKTKHAICCIRTPASDEHLTDKFVYRGFITIKLG